MTCKQCGQELRDSDRFCPNCGAKRQEEIRNPSREEVRVPEAEPQPEPPAAQAPEEEFPAAESSTTEPLAGELPASQEPLIGGTDPDAVDGELSAAEPDAVVSAAAPEDDLIDAEPEEAPEPPPAAPAYRPAPDTYDDEPATPRKRARERGGDPSTWKALAIIAGCVLVVVGLMLAVYFLWPQISARFASAPAASPTAGATTTYRDPVVVVDTEAEAPSHRIYFYGGKGESIHVPLLNEEFAVENGMAECVIADSLLLEGLADGETAKEVTVDATRVRTDGTTEPLSVSYTITVSPAPITLIDPAVNQMETAATSYDLRFRVTPGSKVLVDGNDISDLGNDKGEFTRTVDLSKGQTVEVTIQVETESYRPSTMVVTFLRPSMDVELEFTPNANWSTDKETLTVTGTVDPSTELKANLPLDGEIKVNQKNGKFTMDVKLELYGEQELVLTATGKDGKSSTISHIVTRVPDLDTYTRAAWKMDYERLHAAPNSQKGQIYLCEGTVKDLQTATKGVTFTLDLGNDQLLKMTYTGVHVPTEGKEYRIYADVLGQQDGLPLLGARFIYSK